MKGNERGMKPSHYTAFVFVLANLNPLKKCLTLTFCIIGIDYGASIYYIPSLMERLLYFIRYCVISYC